METKSYQVFWQKIHRSAKKTGLPLRVMFELTYRCNFECEHCYVPLSYKKKKKQELKTKEIFSILDQLAEIGCFYLGFTGGEPFLRRDIFDILWYSKKKGFQIIVYTNGSLIDEKEAKELGRINPNKIDITIPALTKKAFEQVTGIRGSHERVFKVVNILHKKGVKLGFKTCVLKENEKEIKNVQEFAASLGALHRLDSMLSPRLNGDKEPYKYRGRLLASRKSQVTSHKFRTLKQNCDLEVEDVRPTSQPIIPNALFKCGVGVRQAAITPFGELKMCLMIDYPKYKILDTSLKDTWQRLKELVNNIKPDKNYKCSDCKLNVYCKWCPAKAWLYNRSFTSCEPESKYWAVQRKTQYESQS